MHSMAVPDLIWHGRDLRSFPVNSLPSRYAVRYAWGAGSKQTYLLVDGEEILDGRACTARELHAILRRQYGQWSMHPLLVEEFLEDAAGDLRATQFNFYCFSGHVALIEHVQSERRSSQRTSYTPEWNLFPEGIHAQRQCAEPIARPKEMDDMIAVASRLGAAYGTFVRVDLYQSNKGICLGEFSSTPFGGKNIAPWADNLLGMLWAQHCPASV